MKRSIFLTVVLSLCLATITAFAQEKADGKAAAAGDGKARAWAVIEAAQKAKGPLDKLKAVKDVTTVADVSATIQGQSMDLAITNYLVAPNKSRQEVNIPAFNVTVLQVSDGKTGWIDSPQGSGDMPEPLLAETRNNILREWFADFLVAPEGKEIQAVALPDATVNGKAADVLDVTIGEAKFKAFFDKESHLLLKTAFEGMNQEMQKVPSESVYDNYKEVGGIKMAHKASIFQNGEKFADLVIKEIKVNAGVDEAKFKKQ